MIFQSAHHVIYIPGIGDARSYGQDFAIRQFAWFGITPHYLPLGWANQEGYDTKLQRVLSMVDTLHVQGGKVSLIGVSAGASAVLNVYALRQDIVDSVICVCGKINRPENIHEHTFLQNPDFRESMLRVADSLTKLNTKQRQRILSIHPWRDQVVALEDTYVEGGKNRAYPGWNHSSGIFFAATVGVPDIARFIKS